MHELTLAPDTPDPQALACYGLRRRLGAPPAEQIWLSLVTGRPGRAVTIDFLTWGSAQLTVDGFTALLLIWDNASWHCSQAGRPWVRCHDQAIKHSAVGVRIIGCPLPCKSSWLNPIAPNWVHGKRAVAEPDRLLSTEELEARVYAYYGCKRETHLIMPKRSFDYALVLDQDRFYQLVY